MSLRLTCRPLQWAGLLALCVWLAGCAAPASAPDHSAFRAAKPASILVLPPLNDSPEVQAMASVLAQTTYPLAEAGYYVMPVTLVSETFRQNGMEIPADMHEVPAQKLREIFGADTALYITITRYGVTYQVITSTAVVSAQARLVDLRDGTVLWTGSASASSDEGNNSGGGLVGMLVTALIKQIVNSVTDASHPVAGIAANRLLSAGHHPGSILYGPRSPSYGKD